MAKKRIEANTCCGCGTHLIRLSGLPWCPKCKMQSGNNYISSTGYDYKRPAPENKSNSIKPRRTTINPLKGEVL